MKENAMEEQNNWITLSDKGAPTWDKKAPVQGVLIRTQSDVGPNKSKLYTLKTTDGDVGVWGSTVIDSKFEQIPMNSEVRVEALGVAESKAGKSYNDFKVSYRPVPFAEVQQEAPKQSDYPSQPSVTVDAPPVDNYDEIPF